MALTATPKASAEPAHRAVRLNPPNAHRTIQALRDLGYSSYGSVADIVDNSIDAGATQIQISVSESSQDIVITIDDDGSGMDEDTLDEALKLGSDEPHSSSDLGLFGMGLVTASIGLAQTVEVFTREPESRALYGGFDLDLIRERNEFLKWVQPATTDQMNDFPFEHGTRVRLSKIDRIANRRPSEFAAQLRKHLGQSHRQFLKTQVRIAVNGRPVDPIDPLMRDDKETAILLASEIELDGGAKIGVTVAELPDYGGPGNSERGIVPQYAGFYVLRNQREIMAAQTFDFFRKHADYSHFRAEIALDGSHDTLVHTDVRKMNISFDQSALDRIKSATMGLITETARRGRRRANTDRGNVPHDVAESNIQRRAKLIPKAPTMLEKRAPKKLKGAHPAGEGASRQRTAHVTDMKTPAGLRVVFDEADYGDQGFYQVKQEGTKIRLTYNRDHPFYRAMVEFKDDPRVIAMFDYLVFGIANSELMLPEPASLIKANIDQTLRGLLI